MRRGKLFAGAAVLTLLAGCGGGNQGAGGLSAEDERALDNAAAMLDENNFVVPDDSMAANEADVAAQENGAAAPDANAQ